MRKFLNKVKTSVLLAVLAAAVAAPGMVSEAKTISRKVTESNAVYTVGGEVSLDDVTSLKINKKAVKKYKKKIKTQVTRTYPTGFEYATKAYFKDYDAYVQYDDYRNATYNAVKYVATNNYTLRFLKTGTYTLSWAEYEKERLYMDYYDDEWDAASRTYIDYYRLEDHDGKMGTELYALKSTTGGDSYYQGVTSGKIYARSNSFDGSSCVVEASIKNGADGKQHVYCQPRNVIKTTYTKKYKVLKTRGVISSVQLGKTKLTSSNSYSAYGSSSTSKRSFLSGSSGKLTVKTADKNYSITSIVVETYDKEGKAVYTKVGNKKKVTYGANKSQDSYTSSYGSYAYSRASLYKPTTVYVFYKNKFTGGFSKVNSISKDAYGNDVFSMTYRNVGDTKDTTVTTSYLDGTYCVSYTFYKK